MLPVQIVPVTMTRFHATSTVSAAPVFLTESISIDGSEIQSLLDPSPCLHGICCRPSGRTQAMLIPLTGSLLKRRIIGAWQRLAAALSRY